MKLLFKKTKEDKYDKKIQYKEGKIYEFDEKRGNEILNATKDVEIVIEETKKSKKENENE